MDAEELRWHDAVEPGFAPPLCPCMRLNAWGLSYAIGSLLTFPAFLY
jgi:hypothetical protein